MTTYQTQTYRLRQLFSTLAVATASNPVLLEGEKWQEKDAITSLFTGRTKTGKDGVVTGTAPNQTIIGTAFNDLPFDPGGSSGSGTVTSVAGTAPISVATGTTTPVISIGAATPSAAGSMSATDKTKLNDITVDVATVVRKLVRNNTGLSIPKGKTVYQTGSSGTTLTVALADASVEATAAQTLGLTQETIANNATGYVVAVGLLDGINTSTLTEGQIVWLSETAGELTTIRPTQPAHGVVCGYCVKQGPGTSGILYVKVDNGLELDELHDVLVNSPITGHVLRMASDGLWRNQVLAATDVGASPSSVKWRVGDYVCPVDTFVAIGGATSANLIYFAPFIAPVSFSFTELGARVIGAIAGSSYRLAIYGSNSSLQPTGLPIGNTASLSGATAQVLASAANGNCVAGELYWYAVNQDAAGLTYQAISASSTHHGFMVGSPSLGNISSGSLAASIDRRLPAAFNTWPDLTSATTTEVAAAQRCPLPFIKIGELL